MRSTVIAEQILRLGAVKVKQSINDSNCLYFLDNSHNIAVSSNSSTDSGITVNDTQIHSIDTPSNDTEIHSVDTPSNDTEIPSIYTSPSVISVSTSESSVTKDTDTSVQKLPCVLCESTFESTEQLKVGNISERQDLYCM